jgi:O-antigen ligase
MAYDYTTKESNPMLGDGAGSFAKLGPVLQYREALKNKAAGFPGFFWMHNDWLQIFFEFGYIGLGIAVLLFFYALYCLRANPDYFASLMTFGAISFIQMPLRWFLFSWFGAFLLSKAYEMRRLRFIYSPEKSMMRAKLKLVNK